MTLLLDFIIYVSFMLIKNFNQQKIILLKKKVRLNLWIFVNIKLVSHPRFQEISSELRAKASQLVMRFAIHSIERLCFLYCITIRV